MTTFKVTIKGDIEAPEYRGKTYTGFRPITEGLFAGGFKGMAEGHEVVFEDYEIASVEQEQ